MCSKTECTHTNTHTLLNKSNFVFTLSNASFNIMGLFPTASKSMTQLGMILLCDSFLFLNLIYLLAFILTKEKVCNGEKNT